MMALQLDHWPMLFIFQHLDTDKMHAIPQFEEDVLELVRILHQLQMLHPCHPIYNDRLGAHPVELEDKDNVVKLSLI